MLSAIVPVYNRRANMERCLRAIALQLDAPRFEVIIVDDGSTDGLREWVYEQYFTASDPKWKSNSELGFWCEKQQVSLRYMNGGPNKGFRGGRARNLGGFNCQMSSDRLFFVDSDVVLNRWALQQLWQAHQAQPDAIIAGPYFYLPPYDWSGDRLQALAEANNWDELVKEFPDLQREEGPILYGRDLGGRTDFTTDTSKVGKGGGLGALSGNIAYPVKLFWELGGFDEKIVGHGGEDADLGLTADEKQADWLFYANVFGWHVWHERDQRRNHHEVQVNIEYIDMKHGVGRYASANKVANDAKDWNWPGHYHRHHGSRAVKASFDQTVWIVRENHRLGVSRIEWLERLGFSFSDVDLISEQQLAAIPIAGSTPMELTE